jgi:hypothetical protein
MEGFKKKELEEGCGLPIACFITLKLSLANCMHNRPVQRQPNPYTNRPSWLLLSVWAS